MADQDVPSYRTDLNAALLAKQAAENEASRSAASQRFVQAEMEQLRRQLADVVSSSTSQAATLRSNAQQALEAQETLESVHASLKERYTKQSLRLNEAAADAEEARREAERLKAERERDSERADHELAEVVEALNTTSSRLSEAQARIVELETAANTKPEADGDDSESPNYRILYEGVRENLENVLLELQSREPELREQQEELAQAQERADTADERAKKIQSSLEQAKFELQFSQQRVRDLEASRLLMEHSANDKRRQLASALANIDLLRAGEAPLTPAEINGSADDSDNDESETYRLISHRLVIFNNTESLLRQNESILKALRSMSDKVDNEPHVIRATETIEKLKVKLAAVTAERDALKNHEPEPTLLPLSNPDLSMIDLETQHSNETARLKQDRKDAEQRCQAAEDRAREAISREREAKQRLNEMEDRVEIAHDDYRELSGRLASVQNALGRATERAEAVEHSLAERDAQIEQLKISVAAVNSERALWKEQEVKLVADVRAQTRVVADIQAALKIAESKASQYEHSPSEELERRLGSQLAELKALVAENGSPEQVEALKTEVEAAQTEATYAKVELQAKVEEIEKTKSDMFVLQASLESVRRELDLCKKDLSIECDKSSALEKQLASVEHEASNAKSNFVNEQHELTMVRDELEGLNEELERTRKDLVELNQKLQAAEAAEAAARDELSQARATPATPVGVDSSSLQAAIDVKEKEIENLKNSSNQLVDSLRKDLANAQEKIAAGAVSPELGELRAKLTAAEAEISTKDQRILQLEHDRNSDQQKVVLDNIGDSLAAASSQAPSEEESKLEEALKSASSAEQVEAFRSMVVHSERERLKTPLKMQLDVALARQRQELSKSFEEEKAEAVNKAKEQTKAAAEMRVKLKLQQFEKLKQENERLALGMRRAKGGEPVAVEVTKSGLTVIAKEEGKQDQTSQQQQLAQVQAQGFQGQGQFPQGPASQPQFASGQFMNRNQFGNHAQGQNPRQRNGPNGNQESPGLNRPQLNRFGRGGNNQGKRPVFTGQTNQNSKKRREDTNGN